MYGCDPYSRDSQSVHQLSFIPLRSVCFKWRNKSKTRNCQTRQHREKKLNWEPLQVSQLRRSNRLLTDDGIKWQRSGKGRLSGIDMRCYQTQQQHNVIKLFAVLVSIIMQISFPLSRIIPMLKPPHPVTSNKEPSIWLTETLFLLLIAEIIQSETKRIKPRAFQRLHSGSLFLTTDR